MDLPGGVGLTHATVRRFLEYRDGGRRTSRWGVELTQLTVHQRALWGRFVYTSAREADHHLAGMAIRISPKPAPPRSASAIRSAVDARRHDGGTG